MLVQVYKRPYLCESVVWFHSYKERWRPNAMNTFFSSKVSLLFYHHFLWLIVRFLFCFFLLVVSAYVETIGFVQAAALQFFNISIVLVVFTFIYCSSVLLFLLLFLLLSPRLSVLLLFLPLQRKNSNHCVNRIFLACDSCSTCLVTSAGADMRAFEVK